MEGKKACVHLCAEAHKIIKREAKNSGMKMAPLVDRIVIAWGKGEVFFLNSGLHNATKKKTKEA